MLLLSAQALFMILGVMKMNSMKSLKTGMKSS